MKSTVKFISFILLAVTFNSACSKDPDTDFPDDSVYLIKRVTYKGKTTNNYLYNSNGKLAEDQGFYGCARYSYDDNNRLVKVEQAFGVDMPETNEIMTSQNSTFTWNYMYEYDQDSILKYIKLYHKDKYDSGFRYLYTESLEYDNGNIVKKNTLNESGDSILLFTTYKYDDNRNLINEKNYSNIFIEGPGPELQYEFTYKYDNKNNPYRIYKETGRPGLYTNTNNTIESNTIIHNDNPETVKFSTRIESYEYNDRGFPVKVIIGTTVYEYVY